MILISYEKYSTVPEKFYHDINIKDIKGNDIKLYYT